MSSVIDAASSADWQTFASTTDTPSGTAISFQTRSGDTATPDGSWTMWEDISGSDIISADGRYLQYRAVFSTSDPDAVLSINDVSITYDDGLSITVPAITTGQPDAISETSATLHATLTSDGGEAPTAAINWGTQSGLYPNSCTPVTNSGDAYSCDLSGLTAGTTYYVMASATNSAGTGNGSEVQFQTLAPGSVTPPALPADDGNSNTSVTDGECKPHKLSAKIEANGDVKLSWKKVCGLIDRVMIERKNGDGKFKKIASVDNSKRAYVDSGSVLKNGKYIYRIRGYRKASGRYSEYSKRVIITIAHGASVLTASAKQKELANQNTSGAVGTILDTNGNSANESGTNDTSVQNQNGQQSDASGTASLQAKRKDSSSAVQKIIAAIKQFARTFALELSVVATAGMVAGAAAAAVAAAMPLLVSSPAPLQEGLSRLLGFFGFAGKKKNEEDWGTVFDSDTRKPIYGAVISLLSEDGKVADTATSDFKGRFGFLPIGGKYTMSVFKSDYHIDQTRDEDALYGHVYAGNEIIIEDNKIANMNIALKSTTIDWQAYAERKISAHKSLFSVLRRDLFVVLFYVGFIVSAVTVFMLPSIFNSAILIMYVVLLIKQLFFKNKSFGLITHAQTGNPVPFAMVAIYGDEDPKRRLAFAVSDVLGRYYMLAENGNYLLKISGNFLGGEKFEKLVSTNVADGIVRVDTQV